MEEEKRDWSLKNRIVGEELNAIQFVMDYLQVHFNSKGFTFYIWPEIDINNEVFKFGDLEYRNKLCELIGKEVCDVYILDKDLLVIEFKKKERLILNLDPNNPDIVSEIAIFWDENNSWAVFD